MTDTFAQKIAVRGLHVVVGVLVAATPWAVSCSGQTPLPPDPPSVNPGGGGPVEGPGPRPQAPPSFVEGPHPPAELAPPPPTTTSSDVAPVPTAPVPTAPVPTRELAPPQ